MKELHYIPKEGPGSACKNCGGAADEHSYDIISSGQCRTRRAIYGSDNPMVRWLEEHAPREACEPAQTGLNRYESDEDDR